MYVYRSRRAPHIGSLDFDMKVTPVVKGRDYFLWVQQSLNRAGACLFEDGKDTPDLRNAVKKFRQKKGLPAGDRIDVKTQNALIRANERDLSYVLWIQTALNKLRADGTIVIPTLTENGAMNQATRNAIRSFQQQLSTGGGITEDIQVDGFIGPKSESVLTFRSGIKPPPGPQCL
jgi:peptidoglycan hydrolase-like protein with peptidoglycan-binding domain